MRVKNIKRKNNLYKNIYDIENIKQAFDEVCRNIKNKVKVNKYKEYKCIYVSRIYNLLKNKQYKVGPYNVFKIYEPKERRIVSQGLQDKIINHLVSRQILYPSIVPCLIPENVASLPGRGTRRGLELANKYRKICNIKYKEYYILKFDISKFFDSINQDILKEKLKHKIKDKDALKILYEIIDSEEHGIGIGNMTSQIFAIFYLNDLDHYIKEKLKIKYYVRYQDDALLFHESKNFLNECLFKIKKFLEKEKLQLNLKTRIYKNTNNFIFLGRNKYNRYSRYRQIKRKIKKRTKDYEEEKIKLKSLVATKICYLKF